MTGVNEQPDLRWQPLELSPRISQFGEPHVSESTILFFHPVNTRNASFTLPLAEPPGMCQSSKPYSTWKTTYQRFRQRRHPILVYRSAHTFHSPSITTSTTLGMTHQGGRPWDLSTVFFFGCNDGSGEHGRNVDVIVVGNLSFSLRSSLCIWPSVINVPRCALPSSKPRCHWRIKSERLVFILQNAIQMFFKPNFDENFPPFPLFIAWVSTQA